MRQRCSLPSEVLDVDVEMLAGRVRDFSRALKGASVGVFFHAGQGLQEARGRRRRRLRDCGTQRRPGAHGATGQDQRIQMRIVTARHVSCGSPKGMPPTSSARQKSLRKQTESLQRREREMCDTALNRCRDSRCAGCPIEGWVASREKTIVRRGAPA
jgi:hypothetical protein